MEDQQIAMLAGKALEARKLSYCPYSGVAVGAALLCRDGTVYTGCNIENSAFSATVCAERTAIFKAVSEGRRDFAALAVAGGKRDEESPTDYCMPCGVCRQVMAEFCSPAEFTVISVKSTGDYRSYKLGELLPGAFGAASMK